MMTTECLEADYIVLYLSVHTLVDSDVIQTGIKVSVCVCVWERIN